MIHQQQSGHLSSSHHHINIANIISSSFTANTNNNGYRALHFGCSHLELSAVEFIVKPRPQTPKPQTPKPKKGPWADTKISITPPLLRMVPRTCSAKKISGGQREEGYGEVHHVQGEQHQSYLLHQYRKDQIQVTNG